MLIFTDKAREMVLSYIEQNDDELPYVRISVSGSPLSLSFELTLVGRDEREDGEREVDLGDFTVLAAEDQFELLEGATVDFIERVNESGFEVRPRAEPMAAAAAAAPTGPLAARVQHLLDEQVNPGIAAHGGQIGLVDVQDTEVFLEMSGGCQGCAMSRLTLRQGVERMLREAIPEISAVHDITDHASGANPFYDGAPV